MLVQTAAAVKYPATPKFVNGKAMSPQLHDRMYGGAQVERDEDGFLWLVEEPNEVQFMDTAIFRSGNRPALIEDFEDGDEPIGYDESVAPYRY
jgi:Neuraminidase (sialidase)